MRTKIFASILWAGLLLTSVAHGKPLVVERAVAVIDEEPILLSALTHRAQLFLHHRTISRPERAAVYQAVLERMVNERLLAIYAAEHGFRFSAKEVDGALEKIAEYQRTTVPSLLSKLTEQGVNVAAYREEIRYQELKAYVLQLLARGESRNVEPPDLPERLRLLQSALLKELRESHYVEIRVWFR